MKAIKAMSLVVFVLAVTARSIHAQDPAATVGILHYALSTGDSTQVLALLADDVLIYENGSVEQSKDEYRSHHMPVDMEFESSTTRKVTQYGSGQAGDMAWVTTAASTTGTFRGREINTNGTETMLLRRTDKGWMITHIHWSSRSR